MGSSGMAVELLVERPLGSASSQGAKSAVNWLLEQQKPDGHWVAELEGDSILESEFVLMKAFLGEIDDPQCVKACRTIRQIQRPDGGWAIYPGGPLDVSATVKSYFALKLVGVSIDEPDMAKARELILEAGGAMACNSFTRFYLALLGQITYDDCPYVPPELVLVPSWLPFSLAEMSAWTRTMVIPLSLISFLKPVTTLKPKQSIPELFRQDLGKPSRRSKQWVSWSNFFLAADRLLKWYDQIIPKSWRSRAFKASKRWMFEHFESSDGLGAIYPPMLYSVVVLKALGYENNDSMMAWAREKFEEFVLEDEKTLWYQPCLSPVWDTAITMIAVADAQYTEASPALKQAARWLMRQEIRREGDWATRKRFRGIEPSGWSFEYLNEFYADIDDTAMVLMAIKKSGLQEEDPAVETCFKRAVNWLLALQGGDGGWAAFDADIDNQVLTKVPFADHNAMLDPSCADITARILEMLGELDVAKVDHPSVQKALRFLWKQQEPEGCWFGRWGVNYIYGTWQVLQGLSAIGYPMSDPRLIKAANWLESVQQADGAWGESCATYEDRSLMGQGEPTASQTAWAVLGLIAAGRGQSQAVERGVAWLLERQNAEGDWDEASFTGTGFPKVFYLRYHYYRVYFPLMALARYSALAGGV